MFFCRRTARYSSTLEIHKIFLGLSFQESKLPKGVCATESLHPQNLIGLQYTTVLKFDRILESVRACALES